MLALGACSKEPAAPAHESAATAPIALRPQPAGTQDVETITSELVAAGVAASYRATFADGQLQSIKETRSVEATGEYDFRGARLLRYAGAGLSDHGLVELHFDLQGALTASTAGSGRATPEEIAAIRARAQLLRSHALTQRASRSHQPH